jgi:chromosome segregation ATPase
MPGVLTPEVEPSVVYHAESQSNIGKWILLFVAVAFVAASSFFIVSHQRKLTKLEQDAANSQLQVGDLTKRMQAAEADSETLAHQLGMTKKELATKTAELQRQQQLASARFAAQTAQQKKDISEVAGEVGSVKTDVGGVKTDVAATKASLESTISKLQNTIGDLGVQSGLIANTRGDLEALKHKGDRQYYEFTLMKGAKPQAISTVALQLKKTDAKRGKYTLNVTADDKTLEKKDRTQSEPVQFYSGRDHMLYELVVWTVDKKKITGYLSTPKNAPVPITASQQ